ncbi:MAG: glycosyl transferase [Acidimicrobiales bacterium]|nr:glycosyl transferase [Acidimicrobiales bacterium]
MSPVVAPRITFAIPYYSNPGYLLEAIESVRAQTVADWEIVVADDAGPDPAEALVAALGDDRIRYVRHPMNLGLAGNWNACLHLARAPLVTLLHADDRLHPEYAADVLTAADADPGAAALCTDAAVIDGDGRSAFSLADFVKKFARRPRQTHTIEGDSGLSAVLSNNYVFCPSLCYRLSHLDADPFDSSWRMVLDLDHTTRLLLRSEHLVAIRRPLYVYRRHRANQTTSLTAAATRFEEELALYRRLAVDAAEAGWRRSTGAARRHTMVRLNLTLQTATDLMGRRWPAARRKARLLAHDLRHPRAPQTPC